MISRIPVFGNTVQKKMDVSELKGGNIIKNKDGDSKFIISRDFNPQQRFLVVGKNESGDSFVTVPIYYIPSTIKDKANVVTLTDNVTVPTAR